MKVKTTQWEADYSAAENRWTCRDGMVERYLNAECLPEVGDEEDALAVVTLKFGALPIERVVEQVQDESEQ